MLPLGTPVPEFSLPDVISGNKVSTDDFDDDHALLVMFLSRHCPFVKHVQAAVADLANEYVAKGVGVVAICSNDTESHPEDGPEGLRRMAEELGFDFPYLFDESQDVARSFVAACTPDFFLFGGGHKLEYRGQFDGSRPGNEQPIDGSDLRRALDAILQGEPVPAEQRPSVGCNIKWKTREVTG